MTDSYLDDSNSDADPYLSDESDQSNGSCENSDEDITINRPSCHSNGKTNESTFYDPLNIEELSTLMNRIIDEVLPIIDLPRTYLRIALGHFSWDKDRLVEYYFDHGLDSLLSMLQLPKQYENLGQIKSSILVANNHNKIRSSSAHMKDSVFCEICCLHYSAAIMYGLGCSHWFCLQCWLSYLRERILCEGQGDRIVCPAFQCSRLVHDEMALFLLNQDAVREATHHCSQKFQKLLAQTFVQCNREITWCPNAQCCFAARLNPNAEAVLLSAMSPAGFIDPALPHPNKVHCRCGELFCHKCGQSWHEPVPCDLLRLWNKKIRDDSETSNWISANTKDCPKCKATIEKAGGCNHMICKNIACRHEFCWVCLGAWEPHGSSWYSCNRYNEADAKKARDAQEISRSNLQRYLFYFNRYANHQNSLKLEHKLYDQVAKRMEEMQSLGMSWIEVQFLKDGVDKLSHSRRTLLYTYVLSYYLIVNNQVHIFEDNQRDLEVATERLSEYLERDITKDGLNTVKQRVQDYARYCEARRLALLRHVQEGYEKGMWHHTVAISSIS